MENLIIVVLLLCILGGIARYLHKTRKRGQACIGCPYSKQCGRSREDASGY